MHYPHSDVLVVKVIAAWNDLKRMLLDNGSSVIIIF